MPVIVATGEDTFKWVKDGRDPLGGSQNYTYYKNMQEAPEEVRNAIQRAGGNRMPSTVPGDNVDTSPKGEPARAQAAIPQAPDPRTGGTTPLVYDPTTGTLKPAQGQTGAATWPRQGAQQSLIGPGTMSGGGPGVTPKPGLGQAVQAARAATSGPQAARPMQGAQQSLIGPGTMSGGGPGAVSPGLGGPNISMTPLETWRRMPGGGPMSPNNTPGNIDPAFASGRPMENRAVEPIRFPEPTPGAGTSGPLQVGLTNDRIGTGPTQIGATGVGSVGSGSGTLQSGIGGGMSPLGASGQPPQMVPNSPYINPAFSSGSIGPQMPQGMPMQPQGNNWPTPDILRAGGNINQFGINNQMIPQGPQGPTPPMANIQPMQPQGNNQLFIPTWRRGY